MTPKNDIFLSKALLTRDKDKVVKTCDNVAHRDTWEIRIISTLPLFSLDLLRFYSAHEFQLYNFFLTNFLVVRRNFNIEYESYSLFEYEKEYEWLLLKLLFNFFSAGFLEFYEKYLY